ncbi:MAG: hypothetical protein U0835_22985 [Isosphaeraceae bacterium]
MDGIEPTERFSESIQFEFFEYLYHQVLRKEDAWAARELFRERYRENEPKVLAHPYDHQSIGCVYLYTTPHVLLDDLMAQPITEGDIFANANTILLMGRVREGASSAGRFMSPSTGEATAPTRSDRIACRTAVSCSTDRVERRSGWVPQPGRGTPRDRLQCQAGAADQ